MLKPRKAKTSLAIVTRYSSGLKGFPEGFAVYLGKKKLKYIDGNKVGEIIRPLTTKIEPIFSQPKLARVIYRTLQTGFCKATIGMGTKYYGLRKLEEITKNKETYIEELQDSLFGKPDYSHIGINANRDVGMQTSMDVLFKGGIHNGDDRLSRKIANNLGVSGAFDRRLGNLIDNTVNELYVHPTPVLTSSVRIRDVALAIADHNVNLALRKLNFSKVCVKYTSDVLEDVEGELRNCHDDRRHIDRMLGVRDALTNSTVTYTLVDDMLKLPLFSSLIESICAAGKRAMAEHPAEDTGKLSDPTPETLVDWLILFGSLNQPKTVDYLSTLTSDEERPEMKDLFKRVRELANINAGDEAVEETVARARAITGYPRHPHELMRALRNGEPVFYMDTEMPIDMSGLKDLCASTPDGQDVFAQYVKHRKDIPGAQQYTFDSLSQHTYLLGKEEKDA